MIKKIILFFRLDNLRLLDVTLLGLYLFIGITLLPTHEPWTDETQPWVLARDSGTFELFSHIFNNYDRHPIPWYLVMHVLSKFGLSFFSASVANYTFAFLASALFVFKAPLPRFVKYSFLFSYYMVYDYAILARHYSLTILFIMLTALLYKDRFTKPLRFSFIVFILFNCAYITFGLTSAILAFYVWDFFHHVKEKKRAHYTAIGIMLLGMLSVYWQGGILPENHVDFIREHSFYSQNYFLTRTFFPGPFALAPPVKFMIGFSLLLLSVLSLIKRPIPLFILCGSYTLLIYIFKFHHWGDVRHYGFFLISLFFCHWIKDIYTDASLFKKHACLRWIPGTKALTNVVLSLFAVCFIANMPFTYRIGRGEIRLPFSGGKFMAEQLTEIFEKLNLDLKEYRIIGHPHFAVTSILAHLPGVKFWIPGLNRKESYYLNTFEHEKTWKLTNAEALEMAEKNLFDLDRSFVVLGSPLLDLETENYRYVQLVNMDPVPVIGFSKERFYLYKPVRK